MAGFGKETAEKMMAKNKLTVRTGTAEDFFALAKDAARRMDRGERMQGTVTLLFDDPGRMFAVLSVERRRLMRAVGEPD